MNKWELLSVLKERAAGDPNDPNNSADSNKYIAGDEISKIFGVKRASVWRSVNELKKLGYEIESRINCGYKIIAAEGRDVINDYEILSRLRGKGLSNYDVVFKKSTDSTNSDAKKHDGENIALIVAGEQTAGKGRYGRNFISPESKGVYMTIKINRGNISLNIDDITFYPLIAAAAVGRAVSSICGGIEPLIKWPNDLLCETGGGYKKICGILTEASVETQSRSVSYVIVGIGLNVNNEPADFPADIKDTASSLKIISGRHYSRADIIGETVYYFTAFMNMPRDKLLDEYRKRLMLGIDISFAENGRLFKGVAKGINENGNLIAELENGHETTVQSGEINFIQQRQLRQMR